MRTRTIRNKKSETGITKNEFMVSFEVRDYDFSTIFGKKNLTLPDAIKLLQRFDSKKSTRKCGKKNRYSSKTNSSVGIGKGISKSIGKGISKSKAFSGIPVGPEKYSQAASPISADKIGKFF